MMADLSTVTVLCVVGARPNFIKIAPVIEALRAEPDPLRTVLVHTGQHYDEEMADSFFRQLRIAEPEIDLGVGSGTHAAQTAEIMFRFEPVLEKVNPAAVLVVGDVNSTIACALVAAKKSIRVIHVEAGLRSYDRSMPEEVNRVLTDQISDLLFTTEKSAEQNLCREGIDKERIFFVGNVMIDTLRKHLENALPVDTTLLRNDVDPAKLLENGKGYGVVTLHRPSNVDNPRVLGRLLDVLAQVSHQLPLVFPVHPRTEARIRDGHFDFMKSQTVVCLPPLGYLEMLGLMANARLVLTDSGGIQEETTALGVPCVTMRENTERPVTETEGTNTVVGSDARRIRSVTEDILATGGKAGRVPELWDGKAATRIKEVVVRWLSEERAGLGAHRR